MRRMTASWGLLFALGVAAGAWPAPAASGAPPAPYRILAGPYSRKALKAPEGPAAGRFSLRNVVVSVEPLDTAARAAFVSARIPGAGDPFAVAPGRPEQYHAFRVTFDNRSSDDVIFQPGNVLLITERQEQQFPVDLTDLYRLAVHAQAPDPERLMTRIEPVMFDTSTTIPPRTRLERLLVFGALPPRWKEMRVHFSFLQIAGETHTLSFVFHKRPRTG